MAGLKPCRYTNELNNHDEGDLLRKTADGLGFGVEHIEDG
jgi:hypothetical protein